MKIGIQTWGSDGDIRPFLALAGGLSAAGHDISVVVTSVDQKDYSQFGEKLHFSVSHVGKLEYPDDYLVNFGVGMRNTRIPIKQLKMIFRDFFDPVVPEMYAAALKLSFANDLIIGHGVHHPARAAAEKTHRPYVTVSLTHSGIASRYITPMGFPDIGNWANPLWWRICDLIVDSALRPEVNRLRKREGLPPVKHLLKEVWTSERLNLIAVSSALFRKPPDWSAAQQVCGFFSMKECQEKWDVPADLKEFIAAGPPPVYLTVGSMLSLDPHPQAITRLLVDASRLAGCRAIVQSRWDELPEIPDDPALYKIGVTPHQHIFKHCAAVVHHGGAGTSQTALLHGCPCVIIEHLGDQIFWAHELQRIGVATKPLHRRNITSEKLARAIRSVLDNPAMKKKAEKTGAFMRSENGVERACSSIKNHFS
jgi:sterol 3beta-glucosyltransferase